MGTPGSKDWTTDLLIGGIGLFVGHVGQLMLSIAGGLLLMSVLAHA